MNWESFTLLCIHSLICGERRKRRATEKPNQTCCITLEIPKGEFRRKKKKKSFSHLFYIMTIVNPRESLSASTHLLQIARTGWMFFPIYQSNSVKFYFSELGTTYIFEIPFCFKLLYTDCPTKLKKKKTHQTKSLPQPWPPTKWKKKTPTKLKAKYPIPAPEGNQVPKSQPLRRTNVSTLCFPSSLSSESVWLLTQSDLYHLQENLLNSQLN